MRNTITLNGIASTTIAGLLIQELPAISKPLMRTEIEEIDGRDGDIVTDLGYSAYDKEITIGLYGTYDINAVIKYFASEGTVIFSNESDKVYKYKIIQQIDFERLVRYRTATVTFHCQPFKYPTTETPVDLTANLVTGEGTDFYLANTTDAVFAEFTPKGDTSQTTYNGTNLLNIDFADTTNKGLIYTNNHDGTVTISGTTDGSSGSVNLSPASASTLILQNGKYYTQRLEIISGDLNGLVIVPAFKDSNDNIVWNYFSNNGGRQTTDTMTNYQYNAYWSGTGKQINVTFRLWLVEGYDLEAPYEPYVGGIPSPNPNYPQYIHVVTGGQNTNIHSINLVNLVPITNINPDYSNHCTIETVYDSTLQKNVLHVTTTNQYPTFIYTLPKRLESGKYYGVKITYRSKYTGTGTTFQKSFWFGPSWKNNQWDNIEVFGSSRCKVGDGDTSGIFTWPHKETWYTSSRRFYVDPTQYATAATPYARMQMSLGYGIGGSYSYNTSKEVWIADVMLYEITEAEWNEENYYSPEYRPYAVQNYEINLGKNFLDPSRLEAGYLANDGTIVTASPLGERTTPYYIPVCPGQDVSYTIFKTTSTYDPWFGVCEYSAPNEDSFIVRRTNSTAGVSSATFTLGENTYYIRASARNMASATEYQLEYGQKSTYSPYITQIELCKIDDYQDYIYKSGDDWYIHEEIGKVRLDGTEEWKGTSGSFYSLPKTDAKIANLSLQTYTNFKSICSHFTKAEWDANTLGTYYSGSNNLNFNYDNSHSNLNAFKTWLSNNFVRLYAPLTTATDTKIIDVNLISQLNALANSNSYKGDTYIRTGASYPNLPVIIKATTGGNIDGTVTNAGNIYSRPKLTITGSGNIGIYLNGNQMFQIELGDEGHITIDTDAQEAYKDSPTTLKNRLVTGDYSKFKLNPGANQIAFTGIVTEAVIENYTRWL